MNNISKPPAAGDINNWLDWVVKVVEEINNIASVVYSDSKEDLVSPPSNM